jgi:hypothetical protein
VGAAAGDGAFRMITKQKMPAGDDAKRVDVHIDGEDLRVTPACVNAGAVYCNEDGYRASRHPIL